MIEIRCSHTLEGAKGQRAAINALNLASVRPDPFSTFEFYEHVLQQAALHPPAGGLRLWLVLAFRGATLVGYAALKSSRHRVLGLAATKLDWLTGHLADRPHLVNQPGFGGAVASAMHGYLLGRRAEWSLLEFQQQDAGSPLLAAVLAHAPGCAIRQWPNQENGTIELRWPSLADYFAALPKKSRSNVSRQVRTLLAAGRAQFLSSADPLALAPLFELYRGAEAHSWKAPAPRAADTERHSLDFYANLMEPRQPMQVLIQVLMLDGAPIAGLISGAFAGSLYALHIVHDERHSRLAPGSAILLMGVRHAIEGGYRCFNLLRGSGYYKSRWLAKLHPTRSVQVFRAGTPFWWRRMLGDAWRRASADLWPAAIPALLFNPARRQTVAAAALPGPASEAAGRAVATATPPPDPVELARYAELVVRVLAAPGESLSAAQFAAVMPFETLRTAA